MVLLNEDSENFWNFINLSLHYSHEFHFVTKTKVDLSSFHFYIIFTSWLELTQVDYPNIQPEEAISEEYPSLPLHTQRGLERTMHRWIKDFRPILLGILIDNAGLWDANLKSVVWKTWRYSESLKITFLECFTCSGKCMIHHPKWITCYMRQLRVLATGNCIAVFQSKSFFLSNQFSNPFQNDKSNCWKWYIW